MFDVDPQISAVRREVGRREAEKGPTAVVTISQAYDTDVDDLWDACTNPERLPRWFAPVSGELRLGGRYQIEGNAGGTVERCDPPKGFSITWEYGGDVSWVQVRLSAEPGGGARFELEHTAYVDDERWAEFGPGAVGLGYDMALTGLARHLETGESVAYDPTAVGWFASDEGKRFFAEAGEQWYRADVVAGTPAEMARAAADRCIAAYSG
ncbi:SRPBCC family protein [Pseudonocardia sp. DLS-67]